MVCPVVPAFRNERTIMLPFYKLVAILSSGLTSWKMEPFPINSPAL
jgi:hypothetical protein